VKERLREYQLLPETKARKRKYHRERLLRDIGFSLNDATGRSIRSAIKGRTVYGTRSTWWQKALGYTSADLRKHLEGQFTDNMNWENHGTLWEIDHIVPLARFRIINIDCDDFKAAWALSNLRPLLKHMNRAKGAKHVAIAI
jgi:5-methylcytosine-specific restriction endonuclease McrA